MVRRPWVIVVVAFALTRALAGAPTATPSAFYPDGSADPSFEIANYAVWGNQMQDLHRWAYRDFDVEYPPGALAVANLPYAVSDEHFEVAYIVQAVLFDALGLAAVYRLARRRRSWGGVVVWLALLPLLGAVTYSRLDVVVAATLAWALERAEAGRWGTSGAWLGLGVAVKLTPLLVLPAVVLVSPHRWRTALAAAAVAAAFVVPFAGELPELTDQVLGYHTDRGVHAESLWGSLALLARVSFDAEVGTVGAFGATDIVAAGAGALKTVANIAAVGVVLDSCLNAARRVRRGDGAHLALVVAAATALLVAVGRVFSPQYLVWVVAPIAVAVTVAPGRLRWSVASLAVAVVLAHALYPVFFDEYLDGQPAAVVAGVARNLAVLASGVLAARAAWRYGAAATAPNLRTASTSRTEPR